MNNEIKEILKRAEITIRWRNCGHWQTEKQHKNLMDYVTRNSIKITKRGHKIFIKYSFGRMKVSYESGITSLERELYDIIKINCTYLGDKATLKTCYGLTRIN